MTDRTSIYLGQALRRLLDDRPEDKGLWTRSGLLNTVAARYAEMCRRHCPTLTLAEWCACMDALNGVWLQAASSKEAGLLTVVWAEVYDAYRLDALNGVWLQAASSKEAGLLTVVWAEVYDADRLDGLGAKWGIDARALTERIRAYDYATTVALVDAVERWWARDWPAETTREQTIVEIVGASHVREG